MSELPKELRAERARWDRLARDPYYAVINAEANRDHRLTDDTRRELAESGERDIGETMDDVHRLFGAGFRPRRALDFGCGVARLTIPLAHHCEHVTGIDISETMLGEARRNCAAAGVENVIFIASHEYFQTAAEPLLDFVHSFIVFQHIPPRAGIWFADALVRRLAPGGVGALHFTYARRATRLRRLVNRLRRSVPGINQLANVVQRRPVFEPFIPMNNYDVGALYSMLADRGCREIHARLTDHGGHLGAMLYFRKGQ